MSFGQLAFFHWTPRIAVSVERTVTGDGYVFSSPCEDGRLATSGLQSLEGGADDGVEGMVCREEHQGVVLQVKVDIAQQFNRSGQPQSGRNDHAASAFLVYLTDRLVDGVGVQGDAVGFGTEIQDVDLVIGERRLLHTFHFKRKTGIDTFVNECSRL